VKQSRRDHRTRFQRDPYTFPLPTVILIGAVLSALFYGLLIAGPFELTLLKRYCLCHWVAIASVCLFTTGAVGLTFKWFSTNRQLRLVGGASAAMRRLTAEGAEVNPKDRVDWLMQSWSAEPESVQWSWFGQRVIQALQLLQSRGRRHNLEHDLKTLAEQTADHQHESYALLRIVHWAMPMLGFLGTVLGISQTLGQLDTEMLATQQQQAMNQLTAGLYVAFDTTAIALVLTVISMFAQFALHRVELGLMQLIDRQCEDALVPFLSDDPFEAQDSLLTPVREMAGDLVNCVRELVVEQASVWSRSISESQRQWTDWTEKLANEVDSQLVSSLGQAMSQHLAGLELVQEKTGRQFETRLQQWQTTLSEQTRAMHQQQKEMLLQTATLQQLIQSTADLKKLEEAISNNLRTIEEAGNFDKATGRIENATQCVAEAVAMLATSLERAGLVRAAAPQRPRPASTTAQSSATAEPATLPFPTVNPELNSTETTDSAAPSPTTQSRRGKAA
jgi:biopolymer transport protein ExbB/TolQ/cellobiose-specific phosphotransferase system component IIA